MRNKFEFLNEQVKGIIDILMASETQFFFNRPIFNRTVNIREDTPSKLISSEKLPIQSFTVNMNLKKQKWFTNSPYLCRTKVKELLTKLSKSKDLHTSAYEKLVSLGDFNVGMKNEKMKDFCNFYGLTSLNKDQSVIKIQKTHPALIYFLQTVQRCLETRMC